MLNVTYAWDAESLRNIEKLSTLSTQVDQIATEVCHDAANTYAKIVYEYIDGQQGNWEPLTPHWMARKIRNELDTRTLIATGQYKDSIKADGFGDKTAGVVGLWLLGKWHEYGIPKNHLPARPHLIPSLELTVPSIRINIRTRFKNALSGR